MKADAETMALRRLPRPTPLFEGIRPYPWLRVHPAGHPHEGRPVEHVVRCTMLLSNDGEVCDHEYTAEEVDREWLEKQPFGVRQAFVRDIPQREGGEMLVPVYCPRCERAELERTASGSGHVAPPRDWWANQAPVDREPPTGEDLFGGK